ncbi:hypothetical protein Zmor_016236 [Zophobas morio]|uniref:Uncharacterized protein n=1 Tax=Zophobas morio TaxID=2755281 RepID=A0AA38IJF6_9CUCU|nr:hypothetical protein Zmor_016236 [Zophobas morio]
MDFKRFSVLLIVLVSAVCATTTRITFKNVKLLNNLHVEVRTIQSSKTLSKHIPKENFTMLEVTGRIPVLYENSVTNISNVRHLSFFRNEMREIKPGAFKNFIDVKKLAITANNLGTITKGVFDRLTILELSLRYDRITTIPKRALRKLPRLQSLNLCGNYLEIVNEGVFDGINKIEVLDLSRNRIFTFPKLFFKNLNNLKLLFLSQNRFEVLEERIFDDLPQLRVLALGDNNIVKISRGVFVAPNLEQLVLSGNKISYIDLAAFDGLPKLASIDLSSNKIKKFEPSWFDNNVEIYRLLFGHNLIENLPEQAFENLDENAEICFEHNRIKKLAPEAFHGLKSVGRLNLEGNLLEKWNENLLASVEFVQDLNLQNNKIGCLGGNLDNVFVANCTYLSLNPLFETCLLLIERWIKQNPQKNVFVM